MQSIRSRSRIWTRSRGNIRVIIHLTVKENPSDSLLKRESDGFLIICYFLRVISLSLFLRSSKDSL